MLNETHKIDRLSTMMKISAGMFMLTSILNAVLLFLYADPTFAIFVIAIELLTIIFFTFIIFQLKGLTDESAANRIFFAVGMLIFYTLLLSFYYFAPLIVELGDLAEILLFYGVTFFRAITFFQINNAFKSLNKSMEHVIFIIYGMSLLLFQILVFILVYMYLIDAAYIVSTIGYGADIALMIIMSFIIFKNSDKLKDSSFIRRDKGSIIVPQRKSERTSKLSKDVDKTAMRTAKRKFNCANCGAKVEEGESFCLNCGAKVK